jgi:nucleoside transporter
MFSLVGLRLSGMMFIQFFVWGAWFVTVGNYMTAQGMSGTAIGGAYSVGPIAGIISPFFLGMIADRFFATEKVLGVLHILGGIAIFCSPMVVGDGNGYPFFFLGLLLAHTLCYMPTLGLVNTLSFHNMASPEKQFPLIRVFGTLGWIAAGLLVSKWLKADTQALPFQIAGGAGILMGLYSFTLPHTPPPNKGKPFSVRDVLGLDALKLFNEPSFSIFMVSSFLICIPLSAYYAFAPVFVGATGFENPAYNMSFGQMSEVFFMIVMPFFFAFLGVKWMLFVGMLAWVTRYALFAIGAPDEIRWMILIGILLHGVCYDFFFVTGQIYVDKKAPVAIRGQAQGMLVLITLGIGMFIGAQLSGWLKDSIVTAEGTEALLQWRQYWAIPCIGAGVIMVLFAFLFKYDAKKENHSAKEEAEA